MERNAVMSCPIRLDFSQPLLSNEDPSLQKRAENGHDKPWQASTGRSNLSEYSIPRHSLLQSVFSMFPHRFSSVFWSVYNCSSACRNTFQGLSNLVQGSVGDVQGRFCTFSIKIRLLMAILRADWSKITKIFLYSTVVAALSGNNTVAASFSTRWCIALLCNTWATCRRREKRLTRVEKEIKHKTFQ